MHKLRSRALFGAKTAVSYAAIGVLSAVLVLTSCSAPTEPAAKTSSHSATPTPSPRPTPTSTMALPVTAGRVLVALRPGSLAIGGPNEASVTWFIAAGKCTADGCAGGPYTFGSQGELPPGMVLNPHTGELAGTPTVEGTWTITITATDTNDPAETGSLTLDYNVVAPVLATGSSPTP